MLELQLAGLEAKEKAALPSLLVTTITRKELKAFIAVAKAAQCIRHWHDTGRDNEGMIVSAEKVRDLWAELALLSAALPGVKESAKCGGDGCNGCAACWAGEGASKDAAPGGKHVG